VAPGEKARDWGKCISIGNVVIFLLQIISFLPLTTKNGQRPQRRWRAGGIGTAEAANKRNKEPKTIIKTLIVCATADS